MAEHIGVSISQYRKYEQAKARIPFDVVIKAARAMNLDLVEVIEPFAGKDEPLYSKEWIEQSRTRLAKYIFATEDPRDLRMFEQLAGLREIKRPDQSS